MNTTRILPLLLLTLAACGGAPAAREEPKSNNDAVAVSEEQARWFAGSWETTRGIAGDGELVISGTPRRATIRCMQGARIERTLELSGERTAVGEYTVMRFGGNMPWWTDDFQGTFVSRRVTDDSFELAAVGPTGKADWESGWVYVRVE